MTAQGRQQEQRQERPLGVGLEAELASANAYLSDVVHAINDAQVAFHGAVMLDDVVDTSLVRALQTVGFARNDLVACDQRMKALEAFVREWWRRNVDQPFDHDDGKLFDLARALLPGTVDESPAPR